MVTWQNLLSGKLLGFVIFNKVFSSVVPIALSLKQHYCCNVTGQSQESEGYKPAKKVYYNLLSFQVSLCTLTASYLTLIQV